MTDAPIPSADKPPLKIFVAMQYTRHGEAAKWKDPQDVADLYSRVRAALETAFSRPMQLIIEKDQPRPGLVQESMFRSIYEADILIADLTSANPNVFLELGVRYSLRKNLTILTTQEGSVPFNLRGMRVIRYGDGPEQRFIEEMTGVVSEWLTNREHIDSPVLQQVPLAVVPLSQWERVSEARVSALLEGARAASSIADRLRLTEEAVRDDPFSSRARIEHVRALRLSQNYSAALAIAQDALPFFPRVAGLRKELGLTLDRLSENEPARLADAIAAIHAAIRLDPQDADAHCCLGGALRRRAKQSDERVSDLRASLAAYQQALDINRHSTYAGLNVLRLHVMLKPGDPDVARDVELHVRRMYHLCEFEVSEAERSQDREPWWKLFDLGDTLVFKGHAEEAGKTYQRAVDEIPKVARRETVLSPFRVWHELLESDALEGDVRRTSEDLVSYLDGVLRS